MGDMVFKPLIEDMTWSYSRISCFDDCPYRWYLKYISGCNEEPMFYASYGSFMHKLIEKYYRGELTKEDMLTKFLLDFQKEVLGERPQASIVQKYIEAGVEYLKGFQPFPYNMIDVEKRVEFEIEGNHFVGFIDYIGEKDGNLYIVDNKSRDLKPRSKRSKPTLKDKELDDMLRQLYIYSSAIKNEYGKYPKELCFNCFKSGIFISEPFNEDAYKDAIKWATKSIEYIKDEDWFNPSVDYFACRYLCGVNHECCYVERG